MEGENLQQKIVETLQKHRALDEYDLCHAIHGTSNRPDEDYGALRRALRGLRDDKQIVARHLGGGTYTYSLPQQKQQKK